MVESCSLPLLVTVRCIAWDEEELGAGRGAVIGVPSVRPDDAVARETSRDAPANLVPKVPVPEAGGGDTICRCCRERHAALHVGEEAEGTVHGT